MSKHIKTLHGRRDHPKLRYKMRYKMRLKNQLAENQLVDTTGLSSEYCHNMMVDYTGTNPSRRG